MHNLPHLSQLREAFTRMFLERVRRMRDDTLASSTVDSLVEDFKSENDFPLNELTLVDSRAPHLDSDTRLLRLFLGEPGTNSMKLLDSQLFYPAGLSYGISFDFSRIDVGVSEGWIGYKVRDTASESELKTAIDTLTNYIKCFNAEIPTVNATVNSELSAIATRAIEEASKKVVEKRNVASKLGIEVSGLGSTNRT